MMACLLAIELSEREMASKKNNPIKKMKFEGVSNPKREEIEYRGCGKRAHNKIAMVSAIQSSEYLRSRRSRATRWTTYAKKATHKTIARI